MFTAEEIMRLPYFVAKSGHAIVTFPKGCVPRMARRARLVAAAAGLVFGDKDVIHHEDGNKLNDDPANFEVMAWGDHSRLHSTGNDHGKVNKGRAMTWGDKCSATRTGKPQPNISAALTGRTLSDEHRVAIAASLKGKKRGPYGSAKCSICGLDGFNARTHEAHNRAIA